MNTVAALIIMTALFLPASAQAHPMGNFSINHYSGIAVGEKEIRIRYILDMAEIPAFQEIQEIDTDRDKNISSLERETYLLQKATSLASGLVLKIAGEEKALSPVSQEIEFPPGIGGLPTMRLTILYHAEIPFRAEKAEIFYRDNNYPDRAGWKEITAAGNSGIALIGSALPASGGELRSYSEEGIKSPPQVLEANFTFEISTTRSAGEIKSEPGNPVYQSLAPFRMKEVSLGGKTLSSLIGGPAPGGRMALFSLLIAFGLGMLHALSPGHGKTLVAAYLVGSRGTARHAFLLGIIVTLSHTIGVFLLGLATLYLSRFVVPERFYPWLGLFSGVTILAIGFSLFSNRWQALRYPAHSHPHHHTHHHDARIPHHANAAHPVPSGQLRSLIGLGVTGGIIPCPSALVVLLSAIAFHQIGFGLLLIVAFSAGLAATLVGIGMLMVYLGGLMSRLEGYGSLTRLVPVISSGAVAMLGCVIALGSVL